MNERRSRQQDELVPIHKFLHRRVQELPGMTNVKVAQALGYDRPNVVAMMFTGSMKIPIAKVPALAQVLELDPVSLLRRVMLAYAPETWETIEKVLGARRLVTDNEMALVEWGRRHLGAEDPPLLEDHKFTTRFTALLLEALDRHLRIALAERRAERPGRDGKTARANAEMLRLLDDQADARAALRKKLQRDFDEG